MPSFLSWRTVTPSTDPKFMINGTELSVAIIPDTLSRFAVYEVRVWRSEHDFDRQYLLRDAHTVSDDDLRSGKRPAVIGRYGDFEEAIAAAIRLRDAP